MEAQIITIIVHTDIDPSQLLDIANEAAEEIVREIHSYGEEAHFHEEETSVEYADGLEGGEQHV